MKFIQHWKKVIKSAFSKGTFHLLASMSLIRIIGLPVKIFLARYLGPFTFGHIGTINATIDLGNLIAPLGFSSSVLKYTAEYEHPKDKQQILYNGLIATLFTSLLISALLFFIAYATGLIRDAVASRYLAILAWTLCFTAIADIVRNYLQGLKLIALKAKIDLAIKVVSLSAIVIFVYFFRLKGYVYATLFTTAAVALWMLNYIRKDLMPCSIHKGLLRKMLKFGSFSFLALAFSRVANIADVLCITNILKTPAFVGFYCVAIAFIDGLRFIPQAALQTAIPYISEKTGQAREIGKIYIALFKKIGIVMLLVCGLSYFAIGPAIKIFFGNRYLASIPLVQVLLIGLFFGSLGAVGGNTLFAAGFPHINFYFVIVEGILNVSLNIFLINKIGLIGAAWATSLTFIFRAAVLHIICINKFRLVEI